MGFTLTTGVVIDTILLKTLEVDPGRFLARVGAGGALDPLDAPPGLRAQRVDSLLVSAGRTSGSDAFSPGSASAARRRRWFPSWPATFTNAYEETKHRAEALARAVCAANGIQLSVYRPSILYGDSRTGRSLRFNALYYPIEMLLYLRDIHLADARRGGARSWNLGIASLPGGGVRLPLRIDTPPDDGLDLVPIDHFVRAFLVLRDGAAGGRLLPHGAGTFALLARRTTEGIVYAKGVAETHHATRFGGG